MKSKAALQLESGGPLVIEEIEIPDPGPNQVTVAISRAVFAIPRCTSCATPGCRGQWVSDTRAAASLRRWEGSHPRKGRRSRHLDVGLAESH
jgi:hypothetical protein